MNEPITHMTCIVVKGQEIPITPLVVRLLVSAGEIAAQRKDRFVCSDHVLLAVLNDSTGVVPRILHSCGVEREKLTAAIVAKLPPVVP